MGSSDLLLKLAPAERTIALQSDQIRQLEAKVVLLLELISQRGVKKKILTIRLCRRRVIYSKPLPRVCAPRVRAKVACLYQLDIPPDNDTSEQAIRNIKVKPKVSGQFKSGQNAFCILRSAIDTLRKRGVEILPCLNLIIKYQPV